jgi:hypothetical protein
MVIGGKPDLCGTRRYHRRVYRCLLQRLHYVYLFPMRNSKLQDKITGHSHIFYIFWLQAGS